MRITALLPLALFSLTFASPTADLEARAKNPGDAAGAAKLLADIQKITADVQTLNTTVSGFQAGFTNIATALQIQQQTSTISDDLNAAISDANAAGKFNNGQSAKIGIATLSLSPKIRDLLNNIVAHHPEFIAVGGLIDVSQTVESSLTSQRSLTQQLGTAVKAKLTKQYAKLAPGTTNTILGYFDNAIPVFAQCVNPICPPPLGGL